MASWKQKMFNLELTRDIVSYLQKREYDISERRDNFNNIYLTLFYAQKYEGVYKKKYPAWAQFFSWRTCMYIGFLETKLNLTEHNGASAMGEFQILEFNNYKLKDGSINPHPQKFLYPLMCKLGYKKITYGKTLDYFLANPEVQVNCFYYVFMEKLRDSHGDFTSAVVAYNAWQPDPLNSDYWVYYINSQRKFENWFEDVNQKLK
jgi:hypothetical protein